MNFLVFHKIFWVSQGFIWDWEKWNSYQNLILALHVKLKLLELGRHLIWKSRQTYPQEFRELIRDNSIDTYAKFSKKVIFLTPWYVHVRVWVRNVSFAENSAYVLNEWSLPWAVLKVSETRFSCQQKARDPFNVSFTKYLQRWCPASLR